MNLGVVLEAALLTPILQPVFGSNDALGGYGAAVLAQSLAQRDAAFARIVDTALDGAK